MLIFVYFYICLVIWNGINTYKKNKSKSSTKVENSHKKGFSKKTISIFSTRFRESFIKINTNLILFYSSNIENLYFFHILQFLKNKHMPQKFIFIFQKFSHEKTQRFFLKKCFDQKVENSHGKNWIFQKNSINLGQNICFLSINFPRDLHKNLKLFIKFWELKTSKLNKNRVIFYSSKFRDFHQISDSDFLDQNKTGPEGIIFDIFPQTVIYFSSKTSHFF